MRAVVIHSNHNSNSKNKNRYHSAHHLENPILFDHHIRKKLNLNDHTTKQPDEQGPNNKEAWKQFVLFSLALVVIPLLIL